jgi:hypothetical protein
MTNKRGEKEKNIMADYLKRWQYMRSARQNFEQSRDLADQQIEATAFYDNKGKLMVNVPLEQNLIEIALGKEM